MSNVLFREKNDGPNPERRVDHGQDSGAMRNASLKTETISDIGSPNGDRVLLKDEAYATIRDFLVRTEGSDHMLSERALAARLGLGLGSVRSALERLRVEGLISVAPNSGLRLPDLTAGEIIDFYEMRMVVEFHIVKSLAGRLSAAQSRQLEAIIVEQEDTAERHDTDRYHNLDLEFHTAMAEFYGNAEMVRALRQMRDKMFRLSRRLHRSHPERLAVNAAQHRGIMEAVNEGRGDEARRLMETHLIWGRSFTLDPDGRLERG
jgi:DNA-binding GntR family transcriptional regulator